MDPRDICGAFGAHGKDSSVVRVQVRASEEPLQDRTKEYLRIHAQGLIMSEIEVDKNVERAA
ncbi:hypothetical protein [Paraburkholderia sp. JPY419]|uniref:hypothetical protein n=1 Tax=Paraburkholderia sp. JPY419 TaxID=667660 RepID=UPI003D21CA41